MASPDISQLIEQLNHKSSPKRRAAAKKLRKLKAKEACPALLAALQNELNDKRTWETQYQMIMALGESGCIESLDFLTQLAERDFEATMIYVAIGDAVTRLTLINNNNIQPILKMLVNSRPMFIDGALRAIAILKLQPKQSDIEKIIHYGLALDADDNSRTWIAAAAAGWNGDSVTEYLHECIKSNNQQMQRAAKAALKNKYLKWSPL